MKGKISLVIIFAIFQCILPHKLLNIAETASSNEDYVPRPQYTGERQ